MPSDNFWGWPDPEEVKPKPHRIRSRRATVTSAESADEVASRESGLVAQIIEFLRGRGHVGATDDEMREHLRRNGHPTLDDSSPRRYTAMHEGHVFRTGDKRVASSGKKQTVWAYKDFVTEEQKAKCRNARIEAVRRRVEEVVRAYHEALDKGMPTGSCAIDAMARIEDILDMGRDR